MGATHEALFWKSEGEAGRVRCALCAQHCLIKPGAVGICGVRRNDAGRLVVSAVRRGTPGYEAGIDVDDEILAIGEFRVRAGDLDARLARYQPGDKVSILVARRDELRRLELKLGVEPPRSWVLEARPDATADQQERLRAWLGS